MGTTADAVETVCSKIYQAGLRKRMNNNKDWCVDCFVSADEVGMVNVPVLLTNTLFGRTVEVSIIEKRYCRECAPYAPKAIKAELPQ